MSDYGCVSGMSLDERVDQEVDHMGKELWLESTVIAANTDPSRRSQQADWVLGGESEYRERKRQGRGLAALSFVWQSHYNTYPSTSQRTM